MAYVIPNHLNSADMVEMLRGEDVPYGRFTSLHDEIILGVCTIGSG